MNARLPQHMSLDDVRIIGHVISPSKSKPGHISQYLDVLANATAYRANPLHGTRFAEMFERTRKLLGNSVMEGTEGTLTRDEAYARAEREVSNLLISQETYFAINELYGDVLAVESSLSSTDDRSRLVAITEGMNTLLREAKTGRRFTTNNGYGVNPEYPPPSIARALGRQVIRGT